MNTKTAAKEYDTIPAVPQDFDGAVAVHTEALKAIYYHGEELKFIDRILEPKRYDWHMAKKRSWQQVKQQASDVIKSYQLRLF